MHTHLPKLLSRKSHPEIFFDKLMRQPWLFLKLLERSSTWRLIWLKYRRKVERGDSGGAFCEHKLTKWRSLLKKKRKMFYRQKGRSQGLLTQRLRRCLVASDRRLATVSLQVASKEEELAFARNTIDHQKKLLQSHSDCIERLQQELKACNECTHLMRTVAAKLEREMHTRRHEVRRLKCQMASALGRLNVVSKKDSYIYKLEEEKMNLVNEMVTCKDENKQLHLALTRERRKLFSMRHQYGEMKSSNSCSDIFVQTPSSFVMESSNILQELLSPLEFFCNAFPAQEYNYNNSSEMSSLRKQKYETHYFDNLSKKCSQLPPRIKPCQPVFPISSKTNNKLASRRHRLKNNFPFQSTSQPASGLDSLKPNVSDFEKENRLSEELLNNKNLCSSFSGHRNNLVKSNAKSNNLSEEQGGVSNHVRISIGDDTEPSSFFIPDLCTSTAALKALVQESFIVESTTSSEEENVPLLRVHQQKIKEGIEAKTKTRPLSESEECASSSCEGKIDNGNECAQTDECVKIQNSLAEDQSSGEGAREDVESVAIAERKCDYLLQNPSPCAPSESTIKEQRQEEANVEFDELISLRQHYAENLVELMRSQQMIEEEREKLKKSERRFWIFTGIVLVPVIITSALLGSLFPNPFG